MRGGDNSGTANLTYTWSILSEPSGASSPTINVNGTNAAQNATLTFHAAGAYTFQVTITDLSGLTVSSEVTVTVNQTLTSIVVTPGNASVYNGGALQFTATARDQFGNPMNTQPNWTLAGAGMIDGNGVYHAPSAGTGTSIVQVSVAGMTSTLPSRSRAAPPLPTCPTTRGLPGSI